MKIRPLMAGLLVAGMISSTAVSAQDVDFDDRWYIAPYVGLAALDNDRQTDNGDVLYGLSFGKFFSENLSLDIEHDRLEPNFNDDFLASQGVAGAIGQYRIKTYALMARWFFDDWAGARPFLAVGAGMYDYSHLFDDGEEVMLQAGLGIQGDISDHFGLRFQALYRYVDDDSVPGASSFDDFVFTGGVMYKFGDVGPAPVAAVAPEPARDADSDGDGVPDSRDRCPNTPRGVEVDQYGCPTDSDGDGVPNARDKCPDTRPGAVVDLDGCEVEAVIELPNVYFDFDESTIRPRGKEVLDDAAELLQNNERVVVEVAGHTDSIGTDAYNQDLSQRRADSVKDYLVSQGVNASRLETQGYGESRPIATNETDEGRQQNRRVELVVLER